jgi:hypothetical protein
VCSISFPSMFCVVFPPIEGVRHINCPFSCFTTRFIAEKSAIFSSKIMFPTIEGVKGINCLFFIKIMIPTIEGVRGINCHFSCFTTRFIVEILLFHKTITKKKKKGVPRTQHSVFTTEGVRGINCHFFHQNYTSNYIEGVRGKNCHFFMFYHTFYC